MRLRKLGDGQSIACVAPPDICHAIKDVVKKGHQSPINAADVVQWAVEETCRNLERLYPLWIHRGLAHSRREIAYCNFQKGRSADETIVKTFIKGTREKEAESLASLYLGEHTSGKVLPYEFSEDDVQNDQMLAKLVNLWETSEPGGLQDSGLQQEHVRETIREAEREREVIRCAKAQSLKHSITIGLSEFVMSGIIPSIADNSIIPAFAIFHESTGALHLQPGIVNCEVYVTRDYANTVCLPDGSVRDNYLRPVNWVLSSNSPKCGNQLVIISSFEANALLPKIWEFRTVTLHVYAPRIRKAGYSFDKLDFYNIPSEPKKELCPVQLRFLRLFAGQLYIPSLDEYKKLCHYLGLFPVLESKGQKDKLEVSIDGFVSGESRYAAGWVGCPFWTSPLPFIHALLGARRRGQNFSHSHMGQLVHGIALQERDFEETVEFFEENLAGEESDDASLMEWNPEDAAWEARD